MKIADRGFHIVGINNNLSFDKYGVCGFCIVACNNLSLLPVIDFCGFAFVATCSK